tara:strand:- start:6562 stop:6720 length:159 start_codon:yes stop_codon:yes gene_type:complete
MTTELWLSLITFFILIETGFLLYFVRWVLWRVNTKLTILSIDYAQRKINEEE